MKKKQADQKRPFPFFYARSDNWKKNLRNRLEADRALYDLAGPRHSRATRLTRPELPSLPVGAISPLNCSVAEDPRGFYFRVRFAGLEGVLLEQLPTCQDIESEEEEGRGKLFRRNPKRRWKSGRYHPPTQSSQYHFFKSRLRTRQTKFTEKG